MNMKNKFVGFWIMKLDEEGIGKSMGGLFKLENMFITLPQVLTPSVPSL